MFAFGHEDAYQCGPVSQLLELVAGANRSTVRQLPISLESREHRKSLPSSLAQLTDNGVQQASRTQHSARLTPMSKRKLAALPH